MEKLTAKEIKMLMNSNAWVLIHKEQISPDMYDARLELDRKLQRILNEMQKKGE